MAEISVTTTTEILFDGKSLSVVICELLGKVKELEAALSGKADADLLSTMEADIAKNAAATKELEAALSAKAEADSLRALEAGIAENKAEISKLDSRVSELESKVGEVELKVAEKTCRNVFDAEILKLDGKVSEKTCRAVFDAEVSNLGTKIAEKTCRNLFDSEISKLAEAMASKACRDMFNAEISKLDSKVAEKTCRKVFDSEMSSLSEAKTCRTLFDAEMSKMSVTVGEFDSKISKLEDDINTRLGKLAHLVSQVETGLATKTSQEAFDTEVSTLKKRKADSEHVEAELAKRPHLDDMLAQLAKKADQTWVDNEKERVDGELVKLEDKKADKDTMELELKNLDDKKADKDAMAAARDADRKAFEARKAEVDAAMKARKDEVDKALASKTGKDFLAAQVAGLSEIARQAHKELEVALKEKIDFEPSSAVLTTGAKKVVGKVATILKKHKNLKICVEGHTGCKCTWGNSPSKREVHHCKAVELSNKRAESVVEALKASGCGNEMAVDGHGCNKRVGMAVLIFPARGQ